MKPEHFKEKYKYIVKNKPGFLLGPHCINCGWHEQRINGKCFHLELDKRMRVAKHGYCTQHEETAFDKEFYDDTKI